MARGNLLNALDLKQAHENLKHEYRGDWYKDPWAWPEYDFLLSKGQDLIMSWLAGSGSRSPSLVDVPKENWGVRPAVVLDLLDRLCYQALVDRESVGLIGDMSPSAYGWRLPPNNPSAGHYARDSLQWDNYRSHVREAGEWYGAALRTDIVSCFASLDPGLVMDAVESRSSKTKLVERLASFLQGFNRTSRSGLPQRSRASSVLANLILRHFDDVMEGYASEIPRILFGGSKRKPRLSFVRWMDDMWLFSDEASTARRAQLELNQAALERGLHLSSAKTEVLEGEAVFQTALEVELSGIDEGLDTGDAQPLEEAIERVLASPETASRTKVKFLTSRMLTHSTHYRERDFLELAFRMPHASDPLARYFRDRFAADELQEWLMAEASGPWNILQWPLAQYLGMLPSHDVPSKETIEFVESAVADQNTQLPVLAVSAQRLAAWKPAKARAVINSTIGQRHDANARRVLALAALEAGESKGMVRKWLSQDDLTRETLKMLEDNGFTKARVDKNYATHGPAGAPSKP